MFKRKRSQAIFSNFIMLVIFLVFVAIIGILAGIIYFDMATIHNVLLGVNFQIPIEDNSTLTNSSITDFQGILGITVYPLLGLRTSLPYLVYFMVFAFIIALAITSYLSAKNPIFFVLHILFTALMTYFCMIISNQYITLMSNPFINQMMIGFPIYNKLMFYMPQIVFFTALLFGAISFINLIKPQSNASLNQTSLNYGEDY